MKILGKGKEKGKKKKDKKDDDDDKDDKDDEKDKEKEDEKNKEDIDSDVDRAQEEIQDNADSAKDAESQPSSDNTQDATSATPKEQEEMNNGNNNDNTGEEAGQRNPQNDDYGSDNSNNTESSNAGENGTGTQEAGNAGADIGEGAQEAAESAESAAQAATQAATQTAQTTTKGAGAAAKGAGTAAALKYVAIVIIIIIALIGILGAFTLTELPQFFANKLKEIATDVWTSFYGFFVGADEAQLSEEEVIEVAQYLYDMGYDLVGMGFADEVEIYGQKNKKGKEIPVEEGHEKNEIKSIDSPYLHSYLAAENRTYLINNDTHNIKGWADALGKFFQGKGFDKTLLGTGLINLDQSLVEDILPLDDLVNDVKINRADNTMTIKKRYGFLWLGGKDETTFDLTGWSGRYGKPFELLLTLHVATMAPDLVNEFAQNPNLDAKVNIKRNSTDFYGTVVVDGKTYDEIIAAQTVTIDEETGEEIVGPYSQETIDGLTALQNEVSVIKTDVVYISSVTKHWFRNVYFEGSDSIGVKSNTKVGVDNVNESTGEEKPDGIEDYTGEIDETYGSKVQKTRKISSNDNVYKQETDGNAKEYTLDYEGDRTIAGIDMSTVKIKGTYKNGIVQTKDAVRGVTNKTTKKIFNKKYYIYDGTVETAKIIQKARKNGNDSIKRKINPSKDSLNAFTILEETETLDAQFIYRDLKELMIELNYYERSDFDVIEKKILEWPIPDYTPEEWPNRELEKQILEYGTLISSEQTIANSLGISVEKLRELKGNNEEDDETQEGEIKSLKGTLFIGDSYINGLKSNGGIPDAQYKAENGVAPQYWLGKVAELPTSNIKQVCVYLGVNDPSQIEPMKGLIESLSKRYENKKVYIIEVMHVGRNYTSYGGANALNKKIDTFNSQIREKCKTTSNVYFIDASQGLVTGGYLDTTDSAGLHMTSGQYPKWAKNIATQIAKTNKTQTANGTSGTDIGGEVTFNNESGDGYNKEVEYNGKTYKHYQQAGGSWSGFRFPDRSGCSIAGNGCGITSAAIVMSAYPQTADVTPKDVAEATIEQMEESKHTWPMADDIAKAMTELGLEAEGYKNESTQSTANKIQSALNQGKEVIVRLKKGADGRYTAGIHYVVLIKSIEGEGLTIINPSSESDKKNTYEGTLEEFVDAYMGKNDSGGYIITNGDVSAIYNGFEPDEDVIAMGNGKIVEILNDENNLFSEENISEAIGGQLENTNNNNDDEIDRENPSVGLIQDGIRIKLTDNALKGYTLIIYGITLDKGLEVGKTVKATDVIGKTREDSDICLILIDRDKAVIEDIEEYIKVPELKEKEEKKLAGDNAEEKVWLALKDAGYSDEACSGVMGNIFGESGFNAAAIEAGSGEGHGLCQWSFGRKEQLFAFARSRGVDWTDVDLQVEFLMAELTGEGADGYASYQFSGYESAKNQWENAKDVETATTAFCQGFERPNAAYARNQERIDAAKRYLELYGS